MGDQLLDRNALAAEPLALELSDFAAAILEGTKPASNSKLGLEVVLALEALEKSLHARGEPVAVCQVDDLLADRRARPVASTL